MISPRWVFAKMVHLPQYQPGVETPDGEVVAHVSGHYLNARKATALERFLEKKIGLPTHSLGSYHETVGGVHHNPTLVHHGWIAQASHHVLDLGSGGDETPLALADLYGQRDKDAKRIAEALASGLHHRLMLLDNRNLPASIMGHPITEILPGASRGPRRIRGNPAGAPSVGELWSRLGGGTSRIVSTDPRRVRVLDMETGNREWIDRGDFAATHKLKTSRPNPKGMGRKGSSCPWCGNTAALVRGHCSVCGKTRVQARADMRRFEKTHPNPPKMGRRVRRAVASGRSARARYLAAATVARGVRRLDSQRRLTFKPMGRRANPRHAPGFAGFNWNNDPIYRLNDGTLVLGRGDGRHPRTWTNKAQLDNFWHRMANDGDFEAYHPRMGPVRFLRYVGPDAGDLQAARHKSNPKRRKNARRYHRGATAIDVAPVFGWPTWYHLTLEQAQEVLMDVAELADDEMGGDDIAAARKLRTRIGGSGNLVSYAKTLVAGSSRRPNPGGRFMRQPATIARTAEHYYELRSPGVETIGGQTKAQLVAWARTHGFAPTYVDERKAGLRAQPFSNPKGRNGWVLTRTAEGYGRIYISTRRTHDGRAEEMFTTDPAEAMVWGTKREADAAARRAKGVWASGWKWSVARAGGATENRRKRHPSGRKVRGTAQSNPRDQELPTARRTFRRLNQIEPGKVTRVRTTRGAPKTLVKLGDLVSVVYESDKYAGSPDNPKGKKLLYEHKTKRPRPVLATDPEGREVHIVGGRMHPTPDGLVN